LTVSGFIQKSLTPLIYISCIGMFFIGGTMVWNGEMGAVWPAVIGLLMSPIIFPLLMLPSALLAGFSVIFSQKNKKAERVLLVLSGVYLITLMAAYAMVGFLFVVGLPWPFAIGYGVCAGVAPWAILASKDRGNVFFTGLVLQMALAGVIYGLINVQLANTATPLVNPWHKFFVIWALMMLMAGIQLLCEKFFPAKKAEEKKPETISSP
jgi:hypothetical protein